MREQFVMPAKLRTTSYVLLAIGALALLIGIFGLNGEQGAPRFWAGLLFNCIFFLLISVAITLLMSAATLAQASWHIAYKRVMEAIVMSVPVIGAIAFIVFMIIVWGGKGYVYQWADKTIVAHDKLLQLKRPFLNPGFFTFMTLLTICVWSYLGYRMRKNSLMEENMAKGSTRIFWNSVVISAIFVVFYAVTNTSSSWQWIMSIDPHWYSTLFAWYIFASSFVCGIAMLTLFVVTLRNFGFLEWVTFEHVHDLGKFMFAFSIFWTYLWFAQYMLIWYGNIPEETTYFHIRLVGAYHAFFYLNIVINFIMPFLVLMSRDAKRNYTIVVFVAILVFIGHFIDFYMMVMPGIMKGSWHLGWYEIGLTLGFIGLMILLVTRNLSRAALFPKNHPYMKEAIIHRS